MFEHLDEMQLKIATFFDRMIPTDYSEAWFFYELNNNVEDYWYCYVDKNSNNVIPADCLIYRKDIVIKDKRMFEKLESEICKNLFELQNLYFEYTGKRWYGSILQLNGNGSYKFSFNYQRFESELTERRMEWCKEHFGSIPIVKVDMLNEDFPGNRKK